MAKETKPEDSVKPDAPKSKEKAKAAAAEKNRKAAEAAAKALAAKDKPEPMGRGRTITLGVSLVIVAFLLGYLLFALWAPPEVEIPITPQGGATPEEGVPTEEGAPAEEETATTEEEAEKTPKVIVTIFGKDVKMSDEIRLLLLVLIVGFVGSYIHTTISFVNFAGNRRLVKSWFWYYVTRPFAGPFLALVFYLALRGGLLAVNVGSESINQYGVLAVSGLAGLFSKQAMSKLKEVFTNLFKTEREERLQDKIDIPPPEIDKIIPSSVAPGEEATFYIIGKNFVKGSKVLIDGDEREAKYKGATILEIVIEPAETKDKTKLMIQVVNPDGDKSNECELTVKPKG
jgi:hypothetical protein